MLLISLAFASGASAKISVDSVSFSEHPTALEPGKFDSAMTLHLRSDEQIESSAFLNVRPQEVDSFQYRGSPAVPASGFGAGAFSQAGPVAFDPDESFFMQAAQASCMDRGPERKLGVRNNLFGIGAAGARITMPAVSTASVSINVLIDQSYSPFSLRAVGPRVWISERRMSFTGDDGRPANLNAAGGEQVMFEGFAVGPEHSSSITLRVNGRNANPARPVVVGGKAGVTISGTVHPVRRGQLVRIYRSRLGETRASKVKLVRATRTDRRGRYKITRFQMGARGSLHALHAVTLADRSRLLRKSSTCGLPVRVR